MRLNNLYLLMIIIMIYIIPSCKKTNVPTNPIEADLSMEIISYQDAPSPADSNLCYIKLFVEWNDSGLRDTLKADSLAQWFTHSQYQITDMWFPDVETRCLNPIITENIVTLRLAGKDSSLKSQGYSSTSAVVSVCYTFYRHYIFSRHDYGK